MGLDHLNLHLSKCYPPVEQCSVLNSKICACSIRDNSGDPEIRLCVSMPVGSRIFICFMEHICCWRGRIFNAVRFA